MTDSSNNPEGAISQQPVLDTKSSGTEAKANEEDKLFLLKKYEALRSYVEHEDNLINIRLTWLLTIQTLLFTAYGVLEGNLLKYPNDDLGGLKNLTLILKVLGPVSSLLVLGGTHSASRAIDKLVCSWEKQRVENKQKLNEFPPLTGGGEDEGWDFTCLFPHKWASYGIPLVFFFVWMFIWYDCRVVVLSLLLLLFILLLSYCFSKKISSTATIKDGRTQDNQQLGSEGTSDRHDTGDRTPTNE